MKTITYTPQEQLQTDHTLNPVKCPKCGSLETVYNQYAHVVICQDCGTEYTDTKTIIQKKIWDVREWNHYQRSKGNDILIYTRGDGSILQEPRKSGYVAQCGTSSHFYQTKKEAKQNLNHL